ncbi:MAG: hypothetical protein D8M59_07590 [Planctomycetes bacterium]|nr:hypothetical protein [Planctomycetota bacterium]NOG53190.1 hypothetical protein [Planctomycetota bacterium]
MNTATETPLPPDTTTLSDVGDPVPASTTAGSGPDRWRDALLKHNWDVFREFEVLIALAKSRDPSVAPQAMEMLRSICRHGRARASQ